MPSTRLLYEPKKTYNHHINEKEAYLHSVLLLVVVVGQRGQFVRSRLGQLKGLGMILGLSFERVVRLLVRLELGDVRRSLVRELHAGLVFHIQIIHTRV